LVVAPLKLVDPLNVSFQVDIVFKTGFDLENGTLEKWSRKEVDPLDLAVTDFPKLTLFVSSSSLFPFLTA
jgi:hypothetical protein